MHQLSPNAKTLGNTNMNLFAVKHGPWADIFQYSVNNWLVYIYIYIYKNIHKPNYEHTQD